MLRRSHDIYIGGYPRSGNTFAVKAFLLANPGTTILSRLHIPTYIVQSVKRGEPGMVLIRKPVDAAISWAIYRNEPLWQTLAYYNDFHRVLLKHRERLFFVSFEALTSDFGSVMADFNNRWGTNFVSFEHTPQNVARCVAQIEAAHTDAAGRIAELQVPRPSNSRKPIKDKLLRQISMLSTVETELGRANELYHKLVPKNFSPKPRPNLTKSTKSIRLRPAS